MDELIIDRIKSSMDMQNLHAAELARRSGLSRATISAVLLGKSSMGIESFKKLCIGLNESAEYLLFDSVDSNQLRSYQAPKKDFT